eukprot:PhM_4_TR7352/c0_g1_i1/m.26416
MNPVQLFLVTFVAVLGVIVGVGVMRAPAPGSTPEHVFTRLLTGDVAATLSVKKLLAGEPQPSIPRGTELFSFDMQSAACIHSTAEMPWTPALRKYTWIAKKYLTGYEVASDNDVWRVHTVADFQLLLQLKALEVSNDDRVTVLLSPAVRRLRGSLLYPAVRSHRRGHVALEQYSNGVRYMVDYTQYNVHAANEAVHTYGLYTDLPFNITVHDIERLLPIVMARAVPWRGGRALCFPLLGLQHASQPSVVAKSRSTPAAPSSVVALETVRQVHGEAAPLTFNFAGAAEPGVQRSVLMYGGVCGDLDAVDMHLEFADTPTLRALQCETLTLNFEGKVDTSRLLDCLMAASLPVADQASYRTLLSSDTAVSYDLLQFTKTWLDGMLTSNYTVNVTGETKKTTNAQLPHATHERVLCVERVVRAALRKSLAFLDEEMELVMEAAMGDPELRKRKREAVLKGRSPLEKALYDQLGGAVRFGPKRSKAIEN